MIVLLNIPNRWTFGIDVDRLVNLVLDGKKTATTCLYSNVNSAKRVDAWSRLVIPNASNKYNMELSEMLLDGHEYSEDIDIKNNDVIFNYGK